MHRRTQRLRTACRRYWAPLLTGSQTPLSVDLFFTSLPTHQLEDFATQLQTVTSHSLQVQILTRLREEVTAGLWGDPDLQLPTVLALLKHTPSHSGLSQVAGSLATLPPSVDVRETVMTSPEALSWWTDLVQLLPCEGHAQFHYPSYVLTYIRFLRNAITAKTLTIGSFLQLRQFAPTQFTAFLSLLRVEQVNEAEEVMTQSLCKAFALLDQAMVQVERIHSVLSTCEAEHLRTAVEAEVAFLQTVCACPLKDFALPTELESVWELVDKPLILVWLHRILPMHAIASILPVALEHLWTYAGAQALSGEEELAYFQRELLRLSFPPLLLHIELSQEPAQEKERLVGIWYKHHILSFSEFLQETFYEDKGGLVAVLTRDLRDTQLSLRMEHIREKASSFKSAAELQASLQVFLHSPSQRLYVLDYFLDAPPTVGLDVGKRALEEALQTCPKLLCLLVRLPPDCPALSAPWSRSWKLVSIESLSEAFSPSLERLQTWLKRDTKSCLTSANFVQSEARVEAVLTAAFPYTSPEDLQEIHSLCTSAEFCQVLGQRLGAEASDLPDWKRPALTNSQEWLLQDAVEKFLIAQAAALLRPIITTTSMLQAFPSFLQAPEGSLLRKLWKVSFLQLEPEPLSARPLVQLRYPFVLKDYDTFIAPTVYPAQGLLTDFSDTAIGAIHQKQDTGALSLLELYTEDIASLDLAGASYEWQGKLFFQYFCQGSRSFEEAVGRYSDYRDLILFLCKADKTPLLDGFFAQLGDFPGKPLTMPKKILLRSLSDYHEELYFLHNPSSRLYSLEGTSLFTFSCLHKRVTRSSLSAPITTAHPTLLLLDSNSLFCCGGEEQGLMESTYSAKTWTIALPNAVCSQDNMHRKRSYHGLALCLGHVYAIGGAGDLTYLQSCEKFCLESKQWRELPQGMAAGRCYFTPVVHCNKIYLFGGSASETEVIDPVTDQVSRVPVSVPRLEACMCVCTVPGKVLLLSEALVCEVEWETLQCKTRTGTRQFLWSAYPPVLQGREVFAVDKTRAFKWLSLTGELRGSVREPN